MQKKTPSRPPAPESIRRHSVTLQRRGLRLQPTQTTHQREPFAVPDNHTMSMSLLCFLFSQTHSTWESQAYIHTYLMGKVSQLENTILISEKEFD